MLLLILADIDWTVVIGSLIGGAIVGAIPAICGFVKQKQVLGVIAFISCVVSGFLLGLILSVPVAIVFLAIIFKKSK